MAAGDERSAPSLSTPAGTVKTLVATSADAAEVYGPVLDSAAHVASVFAHHALQIDECNGRIGCLSGEIQRLLQDDLIDAGWVWEHPLDAPGIEARPRADFWLPEVGGGIVFEVERGGVTTNGHDLKDAYKAHLTPDARHLFIAVSEWMPTANGRARAGASMGVARRLAGFFGEVRRELDIASCWIFPYGTPVSDPVP